MPIFLISRDEGFVADYADDALFAYREHVWKKESELWLHKVTDAET
jgi:hypothetical protein